MTSVRMIPPIDVRLSLSRMKRDIVQWHRKNDKRVFMSAVTALSGAVGAFIVGLGFTPLIGAQYPSALVPIFIGGALLATGLLFYACWLANQISEAE